MSSVISTQVLSDKAEPNGWRYVKYLVVLEDNLNEQHDVYVQKLIGPGVDAAADAVQSAAVALQQEIDNEQAEYLSEIQGGNDPLHWDNGGFWDQTAPRWGVWGDLFNFVSRYFFSRENQLELTPFNLCWGRVGSTDKRNHLGITNQNVTKMNGDMQIAVNTAASIEGYVPFFEA